MYLFVNYAEERKKKYAFALENASGLEETLKNDIF